MVSQQRMNTSTPLYADCLWGRFSKHRYFCIHLISTLPPSSLLHCSMDKFYGGYAAQEPRRQTAMAACRSNLSYRQESQVHGTRVCRKVFSLSEHGKAHWFVATDFPLQLFGLPSRIGISCLSKLRDLIPIAVHYTVKSLQLGQPRPRFAAFIMCVCMLRLPQQKWGENLKGFRKTYREYRYLELTFWLRAHPAVTASRNRSKFTDMVILGLGNIASSLLSLSPR